MLSVAALAATETRKIVALATPIDCAHYVAAGGTAASVEILSIDYESGQVRFRLLDSSGTYIASGAVFGLSLTLPAAESDVPIAVRAEIASNG